MFGSFSDKLKSKVLYTVAGNHDLWVCGSPGCGDKFDQAGYGLTQFYGQDPIASKTASSGFLDFSVDPDETEAWSSLNQNHTNFFTYNKLGSLGFIGYAGGATKNETLQLFEEACAFMDETKPSHVILLGHWDSSGMGCDDDMTVPAIYAEISAFKGCDIGDRLKAFDGHTHCNELQQAGLVEEAIFMIGGHGMSGCSQYGFAYVDADKDRLAIHYFEERTPGHDNYEAILSCVREQGVGNCTHLATTWLSSNLTSVVF